ncbi:MAG: M23 family metallopeptidase [Sporolactobacillus sp.]
MSAYEEFKRRHDERKRWSTSELRGSEGQRMQPVRKQPASMRPPDNDSVRATSRVSRRLFIQLFFSVALVAAVYEAHVSSSPYAATVNQSVKTAMTEEFQFAAVSAWYTKYFGNPISFLPDGAGKQTAESRSETNTATADSQYAEPVTGEVMIPYSSKTKGVTVKTTSHEAVKAVQNGVVIFVGKKTSTGQTIVIQHADHNESWYGHLGRIAVKVYQQVNKGETIGTTEGGTKGDFYFALKKGQKFIDPIQVMSFD